jgi:hypothetical protein
MTDCISHAGLYDDDDNPLTDSGELYLPGARLCGHRDCVNRSHIQRPDEPPKENPWLGVYAEVIEIAQRPFSGTKVCAVTDCGRAHKGRNLCQNHWQMLLRQRPDLIRKHEHLTLADFPELLPVVYFGKHYKRPVTKCLIETCQKDSKQRGLCSTHIGQLKRLRKRTA